MPQGCKKLQWRKEQATLLEVVRSSIIPLNNLKKLSEIFENVIELTGWIKMSFGIQYTRQ